MKLKYFFSFDLSIFLFISSDLIIFEYCLFKFFISLFLLVDNSIISCSSFNRFLSLFSLSLLFFILSSNFFLILSIIISEFTVFLFLSFSSTKNFKLSSKLADIAIFLFSLLLKYFCENNLYLIAGVHDSLSLNSLKFSIFKCSLSHFFFISSSFFFKHNFLPFSIDPIEFLKSNNLISFFLISSITILISSSEKFK